MISVTLLVKKLVSFVEVTNIRTLLRKMNKLRNIYTIGRRARNITIKKWENNYFKIKIIPFKIIPFIINLDDTMPFVMDKSKSKKGASVSKEFA